MSGTRVPCLYGWQLSISCLLQLWYELKCEIPGIEFLLTRNLQQDCLENTFSLLRAKGGFCETPSPQKFKFAFKHDLVNRLLSSTGTSSSCQHDYTRALLSIPNGWQKEDRSSQEQVTEAFDNGSQTLCTTRPMGVADADVVFYVARYAIRKYLKRHDCTSCAEFLQSERSEACHLNELLTKFKS